MQAQKQQEGKEVMHQDTPQPPPSHPPAKPAAGMGIPGSSAQNNARQWDGHNLFKPAAWHMPVPWEQSTPSSGLKPLKASFV